MEENDRIYEINCYSKYLICRSTVIRLSQKKGDWREDVARQIWNLFAFLNSLQKPNKMSMFESDITNILWAVCYPDQMEYRFRVSSQSENNLNFPIWSQISLISNGIKGNFKKYDLTFQNFELKHHKNSHICHKY